ncbi:hypothetical protein M378DRAFT_171458 [Amanita muscaria Koide BX008]|uniref:Uncharacterized protein n=1 Tax=Amanita muscaria (strain Koide BX008) TaxID=946122 RepID=A0A0C2S4R2_AMAMK|nr:hypothetical protein M378DRAFT_171458 [Amanita muscaria Koide BX008]
MSLASGSSHILDDQLDMYVHIVNLGKNSPTIVQHLIMITACCAISLFHSLIEQDHQTLETSILLEKPCG